MSVVIVDHKGVRELLTSKHPRFFIVAVTDGLGTTNERIVVEAINPLAAKVPLETCLVTHLFLSEECRQFRIAQGVRTISSPFLFLSEENPFSGRKIERRATLELARLEKPDDVKKVLASIAEQAYEDGFVRKAKSGEIIRRVEQTLRKYGRPIKDCLSIIGFV